MKNFTRSAALTILMLLYGFLTIAQTPAFVWDKSEIATAWSNGAAASTIKDAGGVKLQQIGTAGIVNGYIDVNNSNSAPALNSTSADAITITSADPITSIKITYSSNTTTATNPYVGYNSTPTEMGSATVAISSCEMKDPVTGTTGVQNTFTPPAGTKFAIIVRGKACGGTSSNAQTFRVYRIEVFTTPSTPSIAAFTANGVSATINETAKTITAQLVYGSELNAVTPVVTLGGNAISYSPQGPQDFSNSVAVPVVYTASSTTQNVEYAVTLTVSATPPAPVFNLSSGLNNQTVKAGNTITTIIYNLQHATGASVTGLPAGLSGVFQSTGVNTGTFSISGSVEGTVIPGTFDFTITASGVAGYVGDPVTSTGKIIVKSSTAKEICYLVSGSTPSANDTRLYPMLNSNDNYVVTVRTAASVAPAHSVYDPFDLIILNETVAGTNVEAVALKSVDKPILSLKAYTYTTGRWGWGVPDNGQSANGTITIKQPNHPIFTGVNISGGTLNLLTGASGNGIQVNDVTLLTGRSIAIATAPKSTAGNPMAVAIHDVPASVRGVANSKYVLLPVADANYAKMTDEMLAIVNNAINYLLSGVQFAAPSLNISELKVGSNIAEINEGESKITLEVPIGFNLSSIIPEITLSGIGTEVTPVVAQNFSNSAATPIVYTVSDFISKKMYSVTIQEGTSTGIKNNTIKGLFMEGKIIRNSNNEKIEVFDLTGRKVAGSNGDIDLSSFRSGIYLVKGNKEVLKISLSK